MAADVQQSLKMYSAVSGGTPFLRLPHADPISVACQERSHGVGVVPTVAFVFIRPLSPEQVVDFVRLSSDSTLSCGQEDEWL